MRRLKLIAAGAASTFALMALATTASASYLTSPWGTTYTGPVTAQSTTEMVVHSPPPETLPERCESVHLEWEVEEHGLGLPVGGEVTDIAFEGCEGAVITALPPGRLELLEPGGLEGSGQFKFNGTKLQIHTVGGPVCTVYMSDFVGVLTDSSETGGSPRWDSATATMPVTGFLCPDRLQWTVGFTLSPKNLYMH